MPMPGKRCSLIPEIMICGSRDRMERYSPPTTVILVKILFMYSAVFLPGRMPGINPPYLRMLSAASLGLKIIDT